MKKKLMVLVVIALFMTIMFNTGCKKKFDINGVWLMTLNYAAPFDASFNGTITCSGSKTSGSVTYDIADWDIEVGNYNVDGKNATLTVSWGNGNASTFTGSSNDDNSMSGSISELDGATGTWTATR